jgi:hypothetical protein
MQNINDIQVLNQLIQFSQFILIGALIILIFILLNSIFKD